ncbi:hypothetical protein B0H17DRAFT_1128450 [Mycena rosella]|uniref:Uncharacterized protein n=1 Tax=Mycena rosella TaxID=1033263 RepID=A0AAD7GPH1_MYCRO|nr:hypothetical protein B0H17DRAFT_1128450 [Mycena rosella]
MSTIHDAAITIEGNAEKLESSSVWQLFGWHGSDDSLGQRWEWGLGAGRLAGCRFSTTTVLRGSLHSRANNLLSTSHTYTHLHSGTMSSGATHSLYPLSGSSAGSIEGPMSLAISTFGHHARDVASMPTAHRCNLGELRGPAGRRQIGEGGGGGGRVSRERGSASAEQGRQGREERYIPVYF